MSSLYFFFIALTLTAELFFFQGGIAAVKNGPMPIVSVKTVAGIRQLSHR